MPLQDDNFRDFLARRFPRRPAVVSIIELPAIGLSEAQLPFEGSTMDLWHVALRLAKNQGTFDELVAEVTRQWEKDADTIAQLARHWRDEKEPAKVVINLQNPYPGLRPFEEADREQFFGRERWIKALMQSLDQHGFVTLYGGSGSGKSSLVRAGLMPRLKKAGEAVILFTPGKNPFDSLLSMGMGNRAQAQSLVDLAQKGQMPGLFAELAAKCFPGQKLLIIMDQGEELYTRCEQPEVRETFLKCLFHDRGASARVLIGIREDFFDRWNKTRAHDPDFGATNLSLTAPDEDDWRAIITEPARRHGVMFEAELPDLMIERLRTARNGLPLLQFLLQKLWQHDNPADGVLNRESYDSLGGVDHALRGHVEAFIARYPGRESEIRQMLFKLVRFTRQDAQYRALSRSCPVKELPKDLADSLVGDEWRLLTTRGQAGEVELSHEVILRVWPGFEKMEQQRGALHALKSDITDACARWLPARQKSELWAGSRLEESLKRAGMPGVDGSAAQTDDFTLGESPLNENEREFLQSSRAKVIADRKFRVRLLQAATITAGIMVLIAALAALYWKKAEEQTEVAATALSKAQQEEARSDKLTRDVIVKSASTHGNDGALEVMQALAQRPDILESWEGRFLAKRFSFAPIQLRRGEIGLLDSGPLKGSGLYEAAIGLFHDEGRITREEAVTIRGITFEFSNGLLEVFQEKGRVSLFRAFTVEGGSFTHVWLAPDRSCFLVRSSPILLRSMELASAVQDAELVQQEFVTLIPLHDRYPCKALLPPQKEGEPETDPNNFEFLKIEAGGRHFLYTRDSMNTELGLSSFFMRLGRGTSGSAGIEVVPAPKDPYEIPALSMLRAAITKETQAVLNAWIAQGAKIKSVDWSKDELEVAAYMDGYFLVGPVRTPEKMKKLKLLETPAAAAWDSVPVQSTTLHLEFCADGKHLLAHPYEDGQVAVINRNTMTVERLIHGPFHQVDTNSYLNANVRVGSNPGASVIWTTLANEDETFSELNVFRAGTEQPVWKSDSSTAAVDLDFTDRYFAQSLVVSEQFILRDGFTGPILASTSAKIYETPDLIRQTSSIPTRMLLGDLLLNTEGHTEIMTLPKGVVLAPDWSWAAYIDRSTESDAAFDLGGAHLRIIQGLDEPARAQNTLADKARELQIQWLSSGAAHQQIQASLSQSFESRETALTQRLAWPESLPMVTQGRFETMCKQAPEILAAANALLQERPDSRYSLFIKAAAGFLVSGNVAEASREIEAQAIKDGDYWMLPEPAAPLHELANFVVAKGGRLPDKLGRITSDVWATIHSLIAAKISDKELEPSFDDYVDKSVTFMQLLMLSHLAHTKGRTEEAELYMAMIRLTQEMPAWFTASLQARLLIKDPSTMPYWMELFPASFMKSLEQLFQTLPPDQDLAKAPLALAKMLYDRGEKEKARRFAMRSLKCPGFELAAIDQMLRTGDKILAEHLSFSKDSPADYRLARLGRMSIEENAADQFKNNLAKAKVLLGNRPLEKLTDAELRGHLCMLCARLRYGKNQAADLAEAKTALQLLQTRQPALRDLEKLKATSWTEEEASIMQQLVEGSLQK